MLQHYKLPLVGLLIMTFWAYALFCFTWPLLTGSWTPVSLPLVLWRLPGFLFCAFGMYVGVSMLTRSSPRVVTVAVLAIFLSVVLLPVTIGACLYFGHSLYLLAVMVLSLGLHWYCVMIVKYCDNKLGNRGEAPGEIADSHQFRERRD